MALVHGTESNFNELTNHGFVLVDFFATWCGPCKMLGPVLEELANDRANVEIVKVDIDENRNLAKAYGIMSVPTLILFKDGKPVAQQSGFLPKELLMKWIEEHQ